MVLLFGLVKNLVWFKDSLIAADAAKNAKKEAAAASGSAGASGAVATKAAVASAGDSKAKAADDDVDVVGAKIRKRPPKA